MQAHNYSFECGSLQLDFTRLKMVLLLSKSNDCFSIRGISALGRLHSVTKVRFWEAKLQRRLYGDETGES